MPLSDEIRLTGLRVYGYHGAMEHERLTGQEFVIDLAMSTNTRRAGRTDALEDTIHYGEVADSVAVVVAGEPVNLIEALAHRIADVVLAFDGVRAVSVTVHKPHAPIAQSFKDVSVTVHRSAR
ncbi:dihydroneopterin aldolase [Microbacterium sediminicola]|uniref:7,8-dihydroneopterin aldolase n=1 Tax=Microbacterium sediminicola TaxID=415210 RepID=A0ABN2IHE4_9MICO